MRIAHVISTPSGVGGAELVVAGLVVRGREEGWDQVVLNPFTVDADPPLGHVFLGTDYRHLSGRRLTNLPRIQRWLRHELDAFAPDIIHVHLFHALVAVGSLRSKGAVRILTHHHGDFLAVTGRRFEAFLDREFGRRFDRVVAVSEAVRRFLVEGYGYPPQGVMTIRNGWTGDPETRREDNETPAPTIMCVGNLRPEKGHRVLLRAFARALREHPAHLVLVGDGPLRSELEAHAAELGVAAQVRFAGAVVDVWPILASSHVFAFPSLSESLGIAVMEAMAAGLPVVASDVGGIPEVVRHGITGMLVPPGDEEALADGIVQLLRDQQMRTRLGSAGKEAAEEMRIENTVDGYVDLYARLLAENSRSLA